MMGMDENGKAISEEERIRRSIRDIVLTPVGSRVLRRDYGSNVLRSLDAPINSSLRISVAEDLIASLRRWEPRIKVKQVELASGEVKQGKITIKIHFSYRGQQLVEGVVV